MAYSPTFNDLKPAAWHSNHNVSPTSITSRQQSQFPNTAFLHPFLTGSQTLTITDIGIAANGAAATPLIVRGAVYAATSDSNPYPGALLADSGNITITAVTAIKSAAVGPVTLQPYTLYWFGWKREQAATAQLVHWLALEHNLAYLNPVVATAAGNDRTDNVYLPITFPGPVIGAWPNPFTAGKVGGVGTFAPLCYFYVSAVA